MTRDKCMRWTIILALVFGVAGSSQARMGATEADCCSCYGDPVKRYDQEKSDATKLTFKGDKGKFIAGLQQGHVQYMEYQQPSLTDPEIQVLLAANSDGKQWKQHRPESAADGAPPTWTRSDEVIAWYHQGVLTIKSTTWGIDQSPFKKAPLKRVKIEEASPEIIKGRWMAREDGGTYLIEFKKRHKVQIDFIFGDERTSIRGKYQVDYTASPINLEMYNLSLEALGKRRVYCKAEFRPTGELSLDLDIPHKDDDPDQIKLYIGDPLVLRRATKEDFAENRGGTKEMAFPGGP